MCPFVNKTDRRCKKHLTLGNLAHAFAYCADRHVDCPVYMELDTDARKPDTGDESAENAQLLRCLVS